MSVVLCCQVGLRWKIGLCAAGLSYLMAVGYAQAQSQSGEQIKPIQYADQDTGQPLDAAQRPEQGSYQVDRARDEDGASNRGQRQQSTTYFRGPQASGANDRGASASVDHYLASCLQLTNQGEIEINQFAQGRAQGDDVKQFAEQMIEDHRRLDQKLQKLVGAEQSANQNSALNQLLAIDRQIGERCGEMTRAKLEEAPEGEFDKCYVGSQIGAHMQMLAALEVISDQAGGELREVASDAKSTVKQHLDHAEQLMKELDKADTRQARNQ